MKKNQIPNCLTIFRIILFIPIVILVSVPTHLAYTISINHFINENSAFILNISIGSLVAGFLFLISIATDWFDGYLARKWKVVSDWGKLWDPLADKILINSLLIVFAAQGLVHFSLVIIFIVRDILMDGFRMFALNQNILVAANIYGKLKTVFQMIGCSLTLFVFTLSLNQMDQSQSQTIWFWVIQMFSYLLAVCFSVVSCGIYFINISKTINAKKLDK